MKEHFIEGEPSLCLLRAGGKTRRMGRPVLFVHGAADAAPPPGRAPAAAAQVARAADYVRERSRARRLSIIAHSWGTAGAGRYAARPPDRIDRLVLFAPTVRREAVGDVPAFPAYWDVTLEQQLRRFAEDVPDGQPPVLEDFDRWGPRYLASDAGAADRQPSASRAGRWLTSLGRGPGISPMTRRDPVAGADRARRVGRRLRRPPAPGGWPAA